MQNIESRIGSASSVSVNGDELYEKLGAGIKMFQASYNSDGWTGDVKAYEVNTVTGEVNMESYAWSAADELETLDWNNRYIVTYYDDGTTRKGIPFRYKLSSRGCSPWRSRSSRRTPSTLYCLS
jgi:Tfp pilus tip-associated adhesin PilY1